MRMEILGFIPARAGSKEIPKKNIYPLNGKPLIAYTIEAARKSKINRTIVSTDSSQIANIAQQYGAEIPFLRPHRLAQDNSIIEDAILDLLKKLKQGERYEPDIIVLLHPTSPFRTAEHINQSIDLLIEKQADSVISVSEPMEHPAEMVYWSSSGNLRFLLKDSIAPARTQRQEYPAYYFLNGVLYTFTYRSFLCTESCFGEKSIPYLMSQIDSIDINSVDQLLIAESIMKQRNIFACRGKNI